MNEFDFTEIITNVSALLEPLVMGLLSMAFLWFRSKIKSDILKTTMDRLEVSVKNGAKFAIQEGEQALKGKLEVYKSKREVVDGAYRYVSEHSPHLIKQGKVTKKNLLEMIEAKLPEIAREDLMETEGIELNESLTPLGSGLIKERPIF